MPLFNVISIIPILSVIIFIDPILGNQCVDTVGWNDQINNLTCSDYAIRGWCVNKTFISSLQIHSIPSLNFPDLNCCGCGKRASLNLPSTAQWATNGITVAGAANGKNGSSLNRLYHNFGVFCADDDILYIADSGNGRVVLIKHNSTKAVRVIGQDSQSDMFTFNGPADVFVTRTSIYVMDTWNFRVQKWSRNISNPVTVAGIFGVNGSSTDMMKLSDSYNLFVDNYDNLFVGDYNNHRVMRFPWNSTSGTNGLMVAGTGFYGSNSDQLNGPSGVFVTDDGILYIADCNNHRIQKWIIGATFGVTVAGTGKSGDGLSQLNYPYTVLVDLHGYMYITDYSNNRIIRWARGASSGECIVACSGVQGVDSSQLNRPTSIAFDSSGSLYVNDIRNNRVQKFEILNETSGSTMTSQSTTIQATFSTTSEVTIETMTTTISTQSTVSPSQSTETTTNSKGISIFDRMDILEPRFYLVSSILVLSTRCFM